MLKAPSELAVQLGSLFRRRREELGLTLKAMGERLELSAPAVARIEAGADNPTLERVERLAELAGFELLLAVVEKGAGNG